MMDKLALPRGCNSCGTSDVDQLTLHYSQHEHVQTVQGGVCPGVSGQDNVVAARDVSATNYQLSKVHNGTAVRTAPGGLVGVLSCAGSVLGHSRLILTNIVSHVTFTST